ncbi:MAG TPA: carbohydrate ABC transporter permease [bacterium]|nr:carbohydrate ABC transporter permease [bacterium]HNT66242.1 carbohydrate ABC transporter permease [bacterium]HOX86779.1 carbohydrate ABC transporter permease [bacterium]HPG46934.1 carbohydrate ABC transporter permease [bacterium]HPM99298.1 carbohydrate ABC transporter permease [bacterium]
MKKFGLILLMSLVAFGVLLPILWMFDTSLKTMIETAHLPPRWIAPEMSLQAYVDMFNFLPFARYTLSSLITASATTVLTLVIGSLAAFALSRFVFRGKHLFLLVMLLSQMLPGSSIIIPFFELIRDLRLFDTHVGLILVHSAVQLPFVIWLLYGFFRTIPQEVEDAALIDGCSRLEALFRVLLPLALPGLGATAIFAFLGSWNEFFFALILTSSDATQTIPVGIGLFVGEYLDVWNQMSAAAVLFSLPPLVLFLLVQRTFIKGLSAGAIK